MRLINADDLIERINVVIEHGLADPDGLHPVSAEVVLETINVIPSAQPEIIRCKDCKHFEYDHPYVIHGVPVLGHEVCNAWGDGCKTDENGYCFLAERRTDDGE